MNREPCQLPYDPCTVSACVPTRSVGGFTYEEVLRACKNIGYDLSCDSCAAKFFTGYAGYPHEVGCVNEFRKNIRARAREQALMLAYEQYGVKNSDGTAACATISVANLRAHGWSVGVHNDYMLGGVSHTFWLFTKGNRCAKGEGRDDSAAIRQVYQAIMEMGGLDI